MDIGKNKCAIMQPTYLSWAGYFAMINAVDTFVFLDDVQLLRRGEHAWHQRNRICMNGKVHWLVVPVEHSGQEQLLSESIVDDSFKWRKKHLETIRQAYGKKSYVSEILSLLEPVLNSSEVNLCNLNMSIITSIADALNLPTRLVKSSVLNVPGNRSEKLLNICKTLKADIYIAAPGSSAYLEEDDCFTDSGVSIDYFQFNAQPYPQRGTTSFLGQLSIVDVIANLSLEQTKDYIGKV